MAQRREHADLFQSTGVRTNQVSGAEPRVDSSGDLASVDIRPAARRDLPQLSELVRQEFEYQQQLAVHFELVPQIDWAAYVAAKLKHRYTQLLVAEQSGYLVGYVEARIIQPGQRSLRARLKSTVRNFLRPRRKRPRRVGFITDVFVAAEYRQQGIATALLQSSIRWLQSQGTHDIQGVIGRDNEASLSLFGKVGFEPVKLMLSRRL